MTADLRIRLQHAKIQLPLSNGVHPVGSRDEDVVVDVVDVSPVDCFDVRDGHSVGGLDDDCGPDPCAPHDLVVADDRPVRVHDGGRRRIGRNQNRHSRSGRRHHAAVAHHVHRDE